MGGAPDWNWAPPNSQLGREHWSQSIARGAQEKREENQRLDASNAAGGPGQASDERLSPRGGRHEVLLDLLDYGGGYPVDSLIRYVHIPETGARELDQRPMLLACRFGTGTVGELLGV